MAYWVNIYLECQSKLWLNVKNGLDSDKAPHNVFDFFLSGFTVHCIQLDALPVSKILPDGWSHTFLPFLEFWEERRRTEQDVGFEGWCLELVWSTFHIPHRISFYMPHFVIYCVLFCFNFQKRLAFMNSQFFFNNVISF